MRAYIEEKEKELYEEIKLQRLIMQKNPYFEDSINDVIKDLYKQLNQCQAIKKYYNEKEKYFFIECERMFGWYSLDLIEDSLFLLEKQAEVEKLILEIEKKNKKITAKDFLNVVLGKCLNFQIETKLISIFDEWKRNTTDSSIYMSLYLHLKKRKIMEQVTEETREKKILENHDKELILWKRKIPKQKI